LERVVEAAARAGARFLSHNVLFLTECTRRHFHPFIERSYPELVERYRSSYRMSVNAPEDYRRGISELMNKLRERHGLHKRSELPLTDDDERPSAERQARRACRAGEGAQLALF
jgi:DNA repair photolyase